MDSGWQHYFPAGSLHAQPRSHQMLAQWFTDALSRLGEQPLHPAGPDQPLVVRLLCLPTWAPACSVRVESAGPSWRLFARALDGEAAGFALGEVTRRVDRVLTSVEAGQVAELWDSLRFWSLDPNIDEAVVDGTTVVLEAAEHGRYHVAHRDDPEWGDPFGELSDLLIRLAGLSPR